MSGVTKRFAIFRLDGSGHPELFAETDLASEAEHFENLGYLVSPEAANTSKRKESQS